MLTINKQQLNAFSGYMLSQFEQRMIVNFRTNFHNHTEKIEENNMLNMVRDGYNKAHGYNIVTEDDVRRYLEYMVLFSLDFDINPDTEWAREILQDGDLNGTDKMNKIDDIALYSLGN